MTTLPLRQSTAPRLLPTKAEAREMMRSTAVLVTAIVGAVIMGSVLVATVGLLIYYDKPVTELLALVSLVISFATYNKAKTIERQTDGTATRLMDHALGPQPGRE